MQASFDMSWSKGLQHVPTEDLEAMRVRHVVGINDLIRSGHRKCEANILLAGECAPQKASVPDDDELESKQIGSEDSSIALEPAGIMPSWVLERRRRLRFEIFGLLTFR